MVVVHCEREGIDLAQGDVVIVQGGGMVCVDCRSELGNESLYYTKLIEDVLATGDSGDVREVGCLLRDDV